MALVTLAKVTLIELELSALALGVLGALKALVAVVALVAALGSELA